MSLFPEPPNYTNYPDENIKIPINTNNNIKFVKSNLLLEFYNNSHYVNFLNMLKNTKYDFLKIYIKNVLYDDNKLIINIFYEFPDTLFYEKDKLYRLCEVNKSSGIFKTFKLT